MIEVTELNQRQTTTGKEVIEILWKNEKTYYFGNFVNRDTAYKIIYGIWKSLFAASICKETPGVVKDENKSEGSTCIHFKKNENPNF